MDLRNSIVKAENWQTLLDDYSTNIPDRPYTIDMDSGLSDRQNLGPTNSLFEWIPKLSRLKLV